MQRRSWILFLTPVVIWSTTFYAITFQLYSPIPEVYAVGLRFLLASIIIFIYLFARKHRALMGWADHGLAALSGVFAYGISYVLTYLSEREVPSGLVAIAFTLMVFLTPLFARIAFAQPITRATWIGGSLGVLGVTLCVLPGLLNVSSLQIAPWAVIAMLCAAAASSVAAVVSIRLNERQVPVTTYTAWAMLYGAAATLIYGGVTGATWSLDTRLTFWLAFVYLAVLGTVVTFICYLELMRREGSARAMYIGVLSPIGAMLISLTVEGLRLPLLGWLGLACALAGAWFTLRSRAAVAR
jgi:drug/metabolite transporter (DMT)-like permease